MFRAGSRRTHDTGPAAEALRLVKVTKTYGTDESAVTALDGVTLTLGRGTFTAVMGPSGSGKSTLLQCAAGLDRPDSGIVRVDGTELTGVARPSSRSSGAGESGSCSSSTTCWTR